jgi:hypothetical protein
MPAVARRFSLLPRVKVTPTLAEVSHNGFFSSVGFGASCPTTVEMFPPVQKPAVIIVTVRSDDLFSMFGIAGCLLLNVCFPKLASASSGTET